MTTAITHATVATNTRLQVSVTSTSRKASVISTIVFSVTEVEMNMTFVMGMESATVKKMMTNPRKLQLGGISIFELQSQLPALSP